MASYHGPGTCTFYGTANTNQMLMEFMGLHLPGSSFVNPDTPLREALTVEGAKRALAISALGNEYTPVADILDERAFVNGIVGLNATGGSTNLLIHLIAMARAAGVVLDWEDFAELSDATPLMARVYPNGLADVNHFHAAGGLGYMIGELLDAGLLHPDTRTVAGDGLARYTQEPKLIDGALVWEDGAGATLNDKILRPASDPFAPTGGTRRLAGNLGTGVMKVSAVAPERHVIEAPCRIFHDQDSVKAAFRAGEFTSDTVVVVRFQGPKANGMPELHNLTPMLAVLAGQGPEGRARHRRPHVGRLRQGALGHPRQPRGAGRRPARPARRRRPRAGRRGGGHARRADRRRARPARASPPTSAPTNTASAASSSPPSAAPSAPPKPAPRASAWRAVL